jgi:hypothetical protein
VETLPDGKVRKGKFEIRKVRWRMSLGFFAVETSAT